MATIINGLKLQKLYTEPVEKSPKNLEELLNGAYECINQDEANHLKWEADKLMEDRRKRSKEVKEG